MQLVFFRLDQQIRKDQLPCDLGLHHNLAFHSRFYQPVLGNSCNMISRLYEYLGIVYKGHCYCVNQNTYLH